MSAFLAGLSDRNSSVRKTYASALGHLIKVCHTSVLGIFYNNLSIFLEEIYSIRILPIIINDFFVN